MYMYLIIISVIIMPLSFLYIEIYIREDVFNVFFSINFEVLPLNAQIPCSRTSLFEVRKPAKSGELSEDDDWEVHGGQFSQGN